MPGLTRGKASVSALAASLALASCTTMASDAPQDMPVREPSGECDASGVQGMIGQRATAQLGATLLEQTGAATLRWVPPRTAVTMDFRPDRLTVSYDDDLMVERISCG